MKYQGCGRTMAALKGRGRGFTLVEMLLVLVILATLAAIVIPKFAGRTEQARETAAKSQIATLCTALDAFEVDCGYYPRTADGLDPLLVEPRNAKGWRGPYLAKAIAADPWQNPYVYECPGRHNDRGYNLLSMGPDGRRDTEDDINNWDASK